MRRAFYIGRFQPYHNGHQYVLERISGENDEIIIGVGSAQLSHDPENPFTAGERVLMISRALAGIRCPVHIIPIEDINRHALWVAHIRSMAPPFDIVYSSNPLVVQLFREAGMTVVSPAMYERQTHSGTAIREKMLAGDPWEHLVPPGVARVINEIGGIERLHHVAGSD